MRTTTTIMRRRRTLSLIVTHLGVSSSPPLDSSYCNSFDDVGGAQDFAASLFQYLDPAGKHPMRLRGLLGFVNLPGRLQTRVDCWGAGFPDAALPDLLSFSCS